MAKFLYDFDFDTRQWKRVSWNLANLTLPWGKLLLWSHWFIFRDIPGNLYQVLLKETIMKGRINNTLLKSVEYVYNSKTRIYVC